MAIELSTKSSGEELRIQPTELTPEEAALVARIGVFINMRWLAIGGVLIASLLATQVLGIRFPLFPIYIICIAMAWYNVVLLYQARILKAEATGLPSPSVSIRRLFIIPRLSASLIEKARAIGNIHIVLDLLALTVLLHFTGGIENPFVFYFVFHVIIAGILLPYRTVYVLATSAVVLVFALVGLEYTGSIPHVHLAGFAFPAAYQQGPYILGTLLALATCLFGSAFMVTHISGELRKRQREVVILKDAGLREKTLELEEARKEVARLEEARGHLLRFLAIASHDLKAPLAAVQSYLKLMLGGFVGEMGEKQRHMVERSSTRISELLELINDLLDISRIEGGQIVKEMGDVSLRLVVETSVDCLRILATEKDIDLIVQMPGRLPRITASAVRLQQVLTNLLTNAIKFTPEKGQIKLRVTRREGDILVEVSDTGIGIAAEELPKIFDDFYRGSDKSKGGTGLGLSITRRIVEAHGGRIWVESPNPDSESGRGAKVSFILPAQTSAAEGKKKRPWPQPMWRKL